MHPLTVIHAESDTYGTKQENTFIALDSQGAFLGAMFLYPFFDPDLEPEHPHNIYLHLQAEKGQALSETVKDTLLEHALRRAAAIKHEEGRERTRVYASFVKDREDESAYFLQRGFTQDEGMHILERRETAALPPVEAPTGIDVRVWPMDGTADRQRFIEAHRQVFFRHPYSSERLQELQGKPGWGNYTAFAGDEIVGNIMGYVRAVGVGWIEDLFVGKAWRRRGIARVLLGMALAHFHRAGAECVQLEHWSANKPAFQFYRAFGFVQVAETEVAVGKYV